MKKYLGLWIIIGLLGLSSTSYAGLFSSKSPTVAQVNNKSITLDSFLAQLTLYKKQLGNAIDTRENKLKLLDQMIDEEVLYQEAAKENIMQDAEFKQKLEQAKKQIAVSMLLSKKVDSKLTVSEDEARTFYDNNKKLFQKTTEHPEITFDSAKDVIRQRLLFQKRNQQVTTWVQSVKGKYKIKRNESKIPS